MKEINDDERNRRNKSKPGGEGPLSTPTILLVGVSKYRTPLACSFTSDLVSLAPSNWSHRHSANHGILNTLLLRYFQSARRCVAVFIPTALPNHGTRSNGAGEFMVASHPQHLAACERAKQLIVFPSLLQPAAS